MDAWNFASDDLGGGNDEDAVYKLYDSSRDCLILLVDCAAQMFDSPSGHDTEYSCFQLSLKAIYNLMCQKCVSADREFMSVVFFNTDKTDNSHSFKNISILQKLDLPNAERVLEIEEWINDKDIKQTFRDKFGGEAECEWHELFWLCALIAGEKEISFGEKRVHIFTNNATPHGSSKGKSNRITQKLTDLFDQGWTTQLVPTVEDFNETVFWQQAIRNDLQILSICDLLENIRRKDTKSRSLGNIDFKLGDGVELAISLFCPIMQARKPTATKLDRKQNEEVKTVTAHFNETTGEKLLDRDMMKYQEYGGEKIPFEFDEVEKMRRIADTGMVLLGFKPVSYLKPHYQYRTAMFMRPDEKTVRGSTSLYRALLNRCLTRQLTPICQLTARANTPPRLVALLPQEEDRDPDSGNLIESAGFHVIFLPFAEDIRSLSSVTDGKKYAEASEAQVTAAREIICKLQNKNFHPDQFSNPVLKRHYQFVEAQALNHVDTADVKDDTMPNHELVEKRAGALIDDFKKSIFPPDYGTAKRKAPAGKSAGSVADKKPKTVDDVDLRAEAEKQTLGKFTVPQLKAMCTKESITLPTGAKKQDIIDEIRTHFGLV